MLSRGAEKDAFSPIMYRLIADMMFFSYAQNDVARCALFRARQKTHQQKQ